MSRLRQVHTAFVLDQYPVTGDFTTEPYEAGWASEALAFVYVRQAPPPGGPGAEPRLDLRAEVSADGQRWIDHQIAFPSIAETGGHRLLVTHFGNWLRLRASTQGLGADARFVIDLYWVFKE